MTNSDCEPQNGTDQSPGRVAQGRSKIDCWPFSDPGWVRNSHRVGVVEVSA